MTLLIWLWLNLVRATKIKPHFKKINFFDKLEICIKKFFLVIMPWKVCQIGSQNSFLCMFLEGKLNQTSYQWNKVVKLNYFYKSTVWPEPIWIKVNGWWQILQQTSLHKIFKNCFLWSKSYLTTLKFRGTFTK